MTRYLFYNSNDRPNLIQPLLDSKPNNVEVYKWGWTPELETIRENKLSELGVNCPSLPCIIYNRQAWTDNSRGDDLSIAMPQGWFAFALPDDPNTWNWTWINEQIVDEVE